MMLLDINAFVGHWPFKQLKYNTCRSLLQRMDQFGVDASVVCNLSGVFYKNTQSANQELFREINADRRFSERLVPFAIINPIYPGWKNDLSKCIKMGIKGVRLFPEYHDYDLLEPSCIELVKMARDRGLILAFTIR